MSRGLSEGQAVMTEMTARTSGESRPNMARAEIALSMRSLRE